MLSFIKLFDASSIGPSMLVSGRKSPSVESSSSPIGVSSDTGCKDIFRVSLTFCGVVSMWTAISSGVGSRPYSWTKRRLIRRSLLIVSTMWTGMRIVRA